MATDFKSPSPSPSPVVARVMKFAESNARAAVLDNLAAGVYDRGVGNLELDIADLARREPAGS